MTTPRAALAPRRVPTGAELDVLMRLYGYRFTRTGAVAGAEASTDSADLAGAAALGWPIRVPERLTAGEIFERSLAAAMTLDDDAVLRAFVAGLHSAPRGRQTVISVGWCRHLAAAALAADGMPDCGLSVDAPDGMHDVDVTEELLRLALGWSWNEQPHHYLSDLEAASSEGLPSPTDDDRERLRALLDLIAGLPDGTRPGELEKAVARAKIVPRADKYQRYGILLGLAEYGVLRGSITPSWDGFVSRREIAEAWTGGPRSDVPPPLSGWRGGIDERKASSLRSL
ncbi:hypothetical protein [Microbacterium sp. NPDC089696]|uniref:hypothetical protein n=1 Tax=Microbacterium sp. NPDC089696 TaxID=3364199 RepID=UPI003824CE36